MESHDENRQMTRRDTVVLRVTALWTFFVWGVFLRNLIGDNEHSTGFKVVHATLAVVSITLAGLVWKVAARTRRRHDAEAVSPQ